MPASAAPAAALVWDGGDIIVPTALGTPASNQLQGTVAEQLSEIAGRTCYDSLGVDPDTGKPRGRSSAKFHEHIQEVQHFSVYEHFNFTVEIPEHTYYHVYSLLNRPGLWLEAAGNSLQITLNLRALLEWDRYNCPLNTRYPDFSRTLHRRLLEWGHQLAPQVIPRPDYPAITSQIDHYQWSLVPPGELKEHQAWIALYMTGTRGFCYDDQTEVLTHAGWKYFADVDITKDLFATLNPDTHQLEYQRATAKTDEPYDGAMYKLKSQMVDLVVTPQHRMYIQKHDTQAAKRKEEPWRVLTAAEIYGKRVKFKKNAHWQGSNDCYYHIPGDKGVGIILGGEKHYPIKPFLQMLGYWLAEGWLEHSAGSGYQITICQNEGPTLDRIVACVRELGYSPNIKPSPANPDGPSRLVEFWDKDLYLYLQANCGTSCYTKRVPPDVKSLSSELIRTMLDAVTEGDGNISIGGREFMLAGKIYTKTGGHEVVYTTSKQLANDLQELALKSDQSASVRIDDRTDQVPIGALISKISGAAFAHAVPCYIVSFAREKRQTPLVNHNSKRHDSFVPYNGQIYCVTVPNGLLYVRRNGIPVWSGNSHEQVRHGNETGISQRSTRYVDESSSSYLLHPLLRQYLEESYGADTTADLLDQVETITKQTYDTLVPRLQEFIVARGIAAASPVDKTTARKQARGAARNVLCMALPTEMIFSGSVAQWRWMLQQRCSGPADAEIRVIYNDVLPALQASRYGHYFQQYRLIPAPDGLGQVLA